MKDIRAILEEHAAELSEDARAAIVKEVNSNYKTKAESAKKDSHIDSLKEENLSLANANEKLQSDLKELEDLRAELKARDEAEAARKAEAERAEEMEKFRARFAEALGEKQFANKIVEDSVFNQVYEACRADVGKDAAQVIGEITKDLEGVWINPQRDPQKMPTFEQVSAAKASSEEAARKSLAASLFAPKG